MCALFIASYEGIASADLLWSQHDDRIHPIPPSAALEMVAGIPEAHSVLADIAQAGIVKPYARLLEIEGLDGRSSSRDKRLAAEVWKRVVSTSKVKAI